MQRPAGDFWLTAALLAAGAALLFVPADAARPLRALVHDALYPGPAVLNAAARQGRAWTVALGKSVNRKTRPDELDIELAAARLANRQLELAGGRLREQIQKLSAQQKLAPQVASPPPLVVPRLVEARVFGTETAALWRKRKLLSAGAREAIAESALVLDDVRPLVDQGGAANLSVGDAAYAGRIVIGKIAEVGRFTSTLRLVTDPSYSGSARLARRNRRGGLIFGAEGTLVGDRGGLCRLKHITEPVNVGDEVFTGGADGLVPLPMYYGTVVRAELEAGSSEWSVWVKPAASEERLESVLILRRAVNPDRILAD